MLDLAFVTLAVSPVGGLVVAVPLAVFQLGYPAWVLLLLGPLLSYVQVIVVDVAWSRLERWPWFQGVLRRRRNARIERLMASGGAFWATFTLAPVVGPWMVMAFMRYANVSQRRVALPILLSMLCVTTALVAACHLAPQWFAERW
ncbi:MAG: hypothetical protein AB2A00_13600 [Myxococcota bacterium]